MAASDVWTLNSAAIPQADRVERALEYAVLTWHEELALRDLLFQGRDALYYRSAAQVLGLVDGRGQPGELVAGFCAGEADPLELLRACFEHSAVGLSWSRWARVPIWQVDPDSAEAFLAAASELAEATRQRRAKSLRSWLLTLRPDELAEALTVERQRGALLARPVHDFDLSNRTFNVFRREQITTVRDAVALGREGLLGLRAFGAGCARELDAALRAQPPGEGVDELHRALIDGEVDFEGTAISAVEPDAAEPDADADRPQDAIATLGFDPAGFSDVVQLWNAIVGNLEERERLIIQRRSGSLGTRETLTQLGEVLDVTRERVRQLEIRALDGLRAAPAWLGVITARLTALRGDAGYVWLSQLDDDPWFAPLTERPELLRYLCERLLAPAWVAYPWEDGDLILTKARTREPAELLGELRRRLSERAWPGPWAAVEAEVAELLAAAEAEDLGALVLEQLRSETIVDDEDQPKQVLAFGTSREASIRALLAQSPEPVAVAEIQRRFGRSRLPSDCIYVRRGFVTLPSHFEGFERWQERLVPEVERIMADEDPGLQWMAADLLEAVSERSRLPEWLTPMILASMLRRSGAFDDLGRQRFAIRGSSSGERVQLLPTLVEILEDAGAPMPEDALFDALARKTKVLPSTAALLRTAVPLFPFGDGRIGLIERDLPGGTPALREAEELLETELRARGRGLTLHQALELVRPLSEAHAQWTESIVGVVPRVSVTLASSHRGIGLESWEDTRTPTNADLLRDLLDEGEGATTVERVQAAIVELHGKPATRATIAGTANSLGARLRGDWVLSAEVDEPPVQADGPARATSPDPVRPAASPPASPAPHPAPLPSGADVVVLPSITELGIPRVGRGLFTRLTHESVGDWDALLTRCAAHTAEFEARLASNEFLPVEDARNLLATLRTLVARVRDGGTPLQQRLVWIIGRYFEIADDGEIDFAIGGLDDDVEVFNCVIEFLGWPELAVAYS